MNKDKILELGQQLYLARNGERIDLDPAEEAEFVQQTNDWVNQFLPELDAEADWNWSRTNDDIIATAGPLKVYPLPSGVRTLVINPHRALTIQHAGQTVASFRLVNANEIADPNDNDTRDRATVIGRKLVFGREFTPEEQGGDIVADSIAFLPRLDLLDVSVLDIIDPFQLVVLGVLKNQTLPDVVQGGLSPSYTQKYNDLLEKTIAKNNKSSVAPYVDRDSYAFITGVW